MPRVTRKQEEEMIALIQEGGLSQTGIAKIVGISRSTVQSQLVGRRKLKCSGPDFEFNVMVFCSTCKHLVPDPCPACAAREIIHRIQRNECGSGELEFDFDEETRERYEKVRKEKLDEIRRSSPYDRGSYSETRKMSSSCEESDFGSYPCD